MQKSKSLVFGGDMSNSIYCPYCHKYTYLNILASIGINTGSWSMGECNSCHNVVLIHNNTGDIYPNPLPKSIDERIPETIKRDFEESTICLSVRGYRAAAVMARRALQSICLDKGADENDKLEKQIDWLFAQGVITKDLKEWAHEVRLVGNDAAHPKKPEKDTPITKEDAEEIMQLLDQFTQTLYVAPAIAEERRKLRQNS